MGDWYAYATVPGFFQPEGVSCQRAQYGLLPNGTVSVYNVQTTAAGELDDICGYALQVCIRLRSLVVKQEMNILD